MLRPLGGVKVERFSGPAVLRRCCSLSSERVACCQSPRESRGAASVLPFFRSRTEEVARSLVEDAAGENLTTSLRRPLPSLLVAPLDLGSAPCCFQNIILDIDRAYWIEDRVLD